MRAGALDRRITIEQVSEVQGTDGHPVQTWSSFYVCFADYIPVQGSERFESAGLHSMELGRFIIRYKSGITPKMRINYDSKTWKIINIQPIERKKGFDILAEVVN